MYKSKKFGLEFGTMTTKFEAAEVKCPMFENTFTELDLLINDKNDFEALGQQGEISEAPIKARVNVDFALGILQNQDEALYKEF